MSGKHYHIDFVANFAQHLRDIFLIQDCIIHNTFGISTFWNVWIVSGFSFGSQFWLLWNGQKVSYTQEKIIKLADYCFEVKVEHTSIFSE